jgi:tetratricopeptide (TPR) repeat protein
MDQVTLKGAIEKLNMILSAEQVLYQINYRVESIQQSGMVIKAFCPIHQETMIRSLVVDPNKRTFRCNYFNCAGNRGGTLFDLFRLAKDISEEEAVWFWAEQTGLEQDLIAAGEKAPSQAETPEVQEAEEAETEPVPEFKAEAITEEIQSGEVAFEDLIETEPEVEVNAEVEPVEKPASGPRIEPAEIQVEPPPASGQSCQEVHQQAIESFESNKYNQAKISFEKALPLAQAVEDRAECEVMLARCHIQLKNTEEAVKILEEALEKPRNPQIIKKEIHYRLAEAWERGGDKQKALKIYEEVLDTYGPYRDVESKLAQKRAGGEEKKKTLKSGRKISFI